jgi:hypothetical protein
MKTRAILILLIILISLLPAFALNRYLQKSLRPRQSAGRLFTYLVSAMLLVFLYTLLLVLLITWIFPNA